jgi:predicted DNA-binding transcriptional regulator AlpA
VSRLIPTDPAPQPAAKRCRAVDPDAVPPWRRALLRKRAAAALLDISRSALDRLSAAGLCPRPFRAGGAVVWRRRDLLLWVRWGCPARSEFEARLKVQNK